MTQALYAHMNNKRKMKKKEIVLRNNDQKINLFIDLANIY
jgi:hypothetical protein